jgi:hypothetical protein
VKHKSQTESLLDAVLMDDDAQATSLASVRRAARLRRWNRHLQQAAIGMAVLAAGAIVLNQRRVQDTPIKKLDTVAVATSKVLPPGLIVHSDRKGFSLVSTSSAGVEIVRTTRASAPVRIDDDALVQIAPGAVLVRHGADYAELVFPSHEAESQTPLE